jgi:hypothetical protein
MLAAMAAMVAHLPQRQVVAVAEQQALMARVALAVQTVLLHQQ